MVVKLLEIRNRSYYFWDDTIKIKDFNPRLLKLDKKESALVEEYDSDYKKIRFDSDVVLPLNTVLKFHALTVIIRCIIEKKW